MVEGRRMMKKNGVLGLLALLVLLYGAQTGAQQEPVRPSYRNTARAGQCSGATLADRSLILRESLEQSAASAATPWYYT